MKAALSKTPLSNARAPQRVAISPSVTLPFSHPPGTQGPSHSIAERLSASERKLLLFGWLYAFPSHSQLNTTGRRVFSLGRRSSRYMSYTYSSSLVIQVRKCVSTEVSVFSAILFVAVYTHICFTSRTSAFHTNLKAFASSHARKLSWALLVVRLKTKSISELCNHFHTLLPLVVTLWQRQYTINEIPFV